MIAQLEAAQRSGNRSADDLKILAEALGKTKKLLSEAQQSSQNLQKSVDKMVKTRSKVCRINNMFSMCSDLLPLS